MGYPNRLEQKDWYSEKKNVSLHADMLGSNSYIVLFTPRPLFLDSASSEFTDRELKSSMCHFVVILAD